jgi:hypothetical protein
MKCYVKYTKEDGRRLFLEFKNSKLHFDMDFDDISSLYSVKITPTMLETIMRLINGKAK